MTSRRVWGALVASLLCCQLAVRAHQPHVVHLHSGALELDGR